MDFIVTDPDPLLDAFLDKFTSRRSRPSQAEGFRAYVLGLVSEAHRKNVEALSDKTIGEPYQRLHHFLTDALSLLMPKDFRPVGLAMADGTKREVHVARLRSEVPGRVPSRWLGPPARAGWIPSGRVNFASRLEVGRFFNPKSFVVLCGLAPWREAAVVVAVVQSEIRCRSLRSLLMLRLFRCWCCRSQVFCRPLRPLR